MNEKASRVFLSSRTTHDMTYSDRTFDAQLYAILHDLIPLQGEPFFSARNAARFLDEATWIARHCERVFCPSEFTRREAERRFPGHAGKFRTLYPAGLLFEATRDVTPLRPELPADFPKEFAIYCATIEPRKNHAMLAAVWARLHAELGAACPALYLVGRRGWNYAQAETAIGQARKSGAPVAVLSAVGDAELIWLYRHAMLGVYPSITEGFGLGAAECLDFGVPVLISDAPALVEAVQGLMPVQPAAEPDAWLGALQRVIRGPGELPALRATIEKRYVRRSARDFFDNVVLQLSDP